jgi:hypothetical protein
MSTEEKKMSLLRKEMNTVEDDFDIPFDVVKLPSKGLVYDEDSSLCGVTEVSIRSMGALQENILNSPALIKKGTVSSVLVKSCMADPTIDVSSLLMGDKAALMMGIRISGLGHEYKVMTKCPSCGEEFKHTFDLRKCPIKFLDVEPIRKNTNYFETELPRMKKVVGFKLLTDMDDLELMTIQKQKKKSANSDIDTSSTDKLLMQIVSIAGNSERSFVAETLLHKMSSMDIKHLQQRIEEISPGIDLEEEVTCTHCAETDLHRVPLTSEFFRPKMESRQTSR